MMKRETTKVFFWILSLWLPVAIYAQSGQETPFVVLTTAAMAGDTVWMAAEVSNFGTPQVEGLTPTGTATFAGAEYIVNAQTIVVRGALTSLGCSDMKLTAIDLSQCSTLQELNCANNLLTELSLGDNTKIWALYCQQNKLRKLNVEHCSALYELFCFENELEQLTLGREHTSFTMLKAAQNKLKGIDLTGCPNAKNVDCGFNQIASVDLSQNAELTWLLISNNNLKEIDLSAQKKLVRLDCYNNQLSALDLSQLDNLTVLAAEDNQLKSIDLSSCPKLQVASVENNLIESMDLSYNLELGSLWCEENRILAQDMHTLVSTLPVRDAAKLIAINTNSDTEQNVILKADVLAAKKKGWIVYDYNPSTKDLVEYEGSDSVFLVATLHVGEGGEAKILGVEDSGRIPHGSTIEIHAAPNKGYELKSIKVGDADITETKRYLITEDVDIYVTFQKIEGIETLSLTTLTVSPNPSSDIAVIKGVDPYSEVAIYAPDGSLITSSYSDSTGRLYVDTSQYARGYYLIRTKGHATWMIVH